MEEIIIFSLVFLGLLILIAMIATILYYNYTMDCEQNENPLCPRYICQDGCPAQRTDANGNIEYSDGIQPSDDQQCNPPS